MSCSLTALPLDCQLLTFPSRGWSVVVGNLHVDNLIKGTCLRSAGGKARTPSVSVLMSSFNSAPYIGKAIQSVLCQTFQDFELIICDDGSTDGTIDIIKDYTRLDGRIQFEMSKKSNGAASARNRAAFRASGEWFAILDSDDAFLPDKLEKQVNFLQTLDHKPAILGTGHFLVDSVNYRAGTFHFPAEDKKLRARLLKQNPFPAHSSIVFNASAFRRVHGYNERLWRAEDYDLYLRLMPLGQINCLEEPLVEYRLHQANNSKTISNAGYWPEDYSMAVRVCHGMRELSLSDPSTSRDERVWETFIQTISQINKQSGYFEHRQWRRSLQQDPVLYSGREKCLFVFAQLWQNPKHMFFFLRNRYLRHQIDKRYLRLWGGTGVGCGCESGSALNAMAASE